MARRFGRSTLRALAITRRVAGRLFQHGFIHAGNFAYMTIFALFPFFVVVSAGFSLIGQASIRNASVDAMLRIMPRDAASALAPVLRDIIVARHGIVLWIGGIVGLWTVSSLIETIRDILRRAYGTATDERRWWRYRLFSTGVIVLAVVVLFASLYLQVSLSSMLVVIGARFPGLAGAVLALRATQLVPGLAVLGAIYVLLRTLTPDAYRPARFLKWPGALLITVWWGAVSTVLPLLLRQVLNYSLTYGSLAGVMIALFFFWLIGLGVVAGAELNAALAGARSDRE